MIGSWSPFPEAIVLSLVRFVAIFIILYFLAIVIYWFNRTGKVPSLRVIWRIMLQLAKWFPRILVHRIKIVPARIRKKTHSPYPELGLSRVSKKKKSRARKR